MDELGFISSRLLHLNVYIWIQTVCAINAGKRTHILLLFYGGEKAVKNTVPYDAGQMKKVFPDCI